MAAAETCCKPMFWMYLMICAGLVMFAGLMSGLTLGLMSLSLVDLEVLVKAGRPRDRKNAAKILPVVKNQHLLLCTLLIGNSLAMEALPIFLDALVPAWGAVLISVTLILAFGEIIPQAVCTRYGLSVGAKLAGVVRVLLLVFFPIAYPISKLLDYLLGKGHFALLRRSELKTLVDMHGNEAGKGGELTHDETTIISGALDLTKKTAKDAMTTISKTFSLDINSKLDMNTMRLIMNKGHSRVPIYSGGQSNIIGLILVKNLITCRPEDEIPIRNVTIRKIPRVYEDMPLYDILNEFQKGHSHMAVVIKNINDPSKALLNGKSGFENPIDKNRKQIQADETSLIHITVPGSQSPLRNMDRRGMHQPMKKRERGRYENVIDDFDSLPSYPSDEAAIGIITMEDLIEELLQEEILDETDEYVDVHNKIRINMLPPKKSSPRSSGPLPHSQRRTPTTSPFSPYNRTSVSQSPASSTAKALDSMLPVSTSQGKSLPNSPKQQTIPGSPSLSSCSVRQFMFLFIQFSTSAS